MKNLWIVIGATLTVAGVIASTAQAETKEVTIAYQDMVVPYRVAQEAKAVEHATGYKIKWRQFAGGPDIIKAMASGAVQIGEVGSVPTSVAISRGEPFELFWILEDISDAEALVARNGSGVNSVADLKGKKVGLLMNSTTHFHLVMALEHAKVNPADVKIMNMRPPEVRGAWQRGDIDATFIWDPVLAELKKTGKIITTSRVIAAETGKATFDGVIANRDWAKAHQDFMFKFTKILADSDADYRNNKEKWTPDSPEIIAIAKWTGSKPENVVASMVLYHFPTVQEQAAKWLGGGKDSIAAKALTATADFQLSQKQIEKKLPDYSVVVNPVYAAEVVKSETASGAGS